MKRNGIKILLVFLISFISFTAQAQTRSKAKGRVITGQVTGSEGETLIGAVIKVKGTTRGTITDYDGKYRIVIKPHLNDKFLEFVYLGEKKVVKIGKKNIINVQIATVKMLDNVVVTGFQTLSKERASGAFEMVNKKILEKIPSSDVSSLLRGQMSGVNVDNNGHINIRGISYISKGYRSPLIVVDGFPIEGGIETINPNNIKNVTVLKDAAAASIWGARSANGVIVITTKTADASSQDGLSVSFNSFIRTSDKIDLDYANPIANAKDQLELEKYFADQYSTYDPNAIYEPKQLSFTNAQAQRTQGAYLYAMLNKGYLSQAAVDKIVNDLQNVNYQDDVYKYLLRKPIYNQYNLSIRGKSKRNSFNFSLLYDKNLSDFKGTDNDRIIADFKNRYTINKYITVNASAYMSTRKNKSNGSNLSEVRSLAAYDRLVNPDGTYNNHTADMNYGMRNYLNTLPFGYSWNRNILQDSQDKDIKSNTIQLRLQGGIDIKLFKGLKFSTKYQYEKLRTNSSSYYGPSTYFTKSTINKFSEVINNQTEVAQSYFPKGGIRNGITTRNTDAYNFRAQLDFRKKFAKKHEVSAIAGTEIIENSQTGVTAPWEFGVDPKINGIATLPNTENIAKIYSGDSQSLPHSVKSSHNYSKRRYFSLYLNSSYTFDKKYTATFSVRTDASNIISSKPEYRYVPLWSAGFNWNASKEEFIKNIHFIDQLIVRGSYGLNAQGAIGSTNVTTINHMVGDQYNNYNPLAGIGQHGNPDLQWEKTQNFNIGVDYMLNKGMFFGKIDFYNKKGVDLLYSRTLPSTLGFGSSMKMNYASVLNRGFEFQIGGKFNITKNITFTSDFNYSYNYNKILALESGNRTVYNDTGTSAFIKGGTVSDFYAFKYDGYFDGIPYVVNKDGKHHPMNASIPNVSNDDAKLLYNMGTTIAPHIIGWTNTLEIKDFSLTTVITGKFGHVFHRTPVFTSRNASTMTSFNKNLPNYIDNRWAKDFPGLIDATNLNQLRERGLYINYLSSDVDNASFIRFNNIIMDYNFTSLTRNVKYLNQLKGIKLYAEVKSLGILWCANKWDMDPEYVEGRIKPQTSYSIGVKLNF